MAKTQGGKQQRRDVNAASRAALALKLRAQKASYDDIASLCGFASRGAAYNAVQRELSRVVSQNVDELRREELAMLDLLQAECSTIAFDRNNKARLFAVDRLLLIMERRAKLMGLDQTKESAQASAQVVIREAPPGYFGAGAIAPPSQPQPIAAEGEASS